MTRRLRRVAYAVLQRLARCLEDVADAVCPLTIEQRIAAACAAHEAPPPPPPSPTPAILPTADPIELPLDDTRPPGTMACWHCRVLVDGALAAHEDAAHQRRLLRFLNLPPFSVGARGPMCAWHAVLAAVDGGVGPTAGARSVAS